MTETSMRIIAAIKAVPRGRVSSYRDIARRAGIPNGARQVARILHSCSEAYGLPWHRIIKADGRIALGAGYGGELQAAMLRSEGVEVQDGRRVDLSRYLDLDEKG